MSRMFHIIEKREKGEAPISIGTSLAIESLCGFGEFPNANPPVYQYEQIWINLRTLFRNCLGAVPTADQVDLKSTDVGNGVLEDMGILKSTLELKSTGKIEIIFYYCTYDSFQKEFPKGKWKELRTSKQQYEHSLEEGTLKYLLGDTDMLEMFDVREFNTIPNDKGLKAVMLTNYPSDLLSYRNFVKLILLESHTGALKPRSEWFSKLTGGKNFTRIPFNRLTLQVFGDNNLLFSSMSLGIKNRIHEISEKDNWTPVTTYDKIRNSINKIYDPVEKTFFLTLLGKQ